jgi:DNA-directed RNA polymerase subunit RPC12/RpoP
MEETEAQAARIRATGNYDLSNSATSEAVQKTYIPVSCPVCSTKMYATPEEVGTELTCSDCETKVVVPPLETMPVEPGLSKEELEKRKREYGLLDDDYRPSPELETVRPYIGLKCSVCGTRLLATPDQVGQEIECPDCQRSTLVRTLPPGAVPLAPEIDRSEQYGAGEPSAAPDYSALVEDVIRRGEERLKEEDRYEESKPTSEERLRPRTPPAWLFRSGILRFMFHPDARNRWIVLTLCLLGCALMMSTGQKLMSLPDPILYYLGLAFATLSFVGALVCVPMISPVLLSIAQDTSEGNDDIENWHELEWFDAILESLYIVNPLAISGLPGVVLASMLEADPLAAMIIAYTSAVILYPVAFMCSMDTGSPWSPFSLPVLRAIPYTWLAWFKFYFLSTALLAVFFVAAYFLPLLIGHPGAWLVTGLFVPTLMVYFRLIGRLALFTSDTSIDADSQESESGTRTDELKYERLFRDKD